MAIKVAINGFGRIGRLTFRILMEQSDKFDVVAINDLTDNQMLATLLKYDTAHGRYPGTVDYDDNNLIVGGKKIKATAIRNPAECPWGELGVDFVIESTGVFAAAKTADKPGYDTHLDAGAKRVILTQPAKDKVLTCVMGVNDDQLNADLKIVSNASCTTNCLAPVVHVLHNAVGIEHGFMTTIHS
ncbi:MAG: aldehyde dehydrogenase, partial [Planctomycetales bacterium]|nr:aldehyde dehydrogenase [Planctomycetales bacterium]